MLECAMRYAQCLARACTHHAGVTIRARRAAKHCKIVVVVTTRRIQIRNGSNNKMSRNVYALMRLAA